MASEIRFEAKTTFRNAGRPQHPLLHHYATQGHCNTVRYYNFIVFLPSPAADRLAMAKVFPYAHCCPGSIRHSGIYRCQVFLPKLNLSSYLLRFSPSIHLTSFCLAFFPHHVSTSGVSEPAIYSQVSTLHVQPFHHLIDYRRSAVFAGQSLLVYDYLITLPLEVWISATLMK